MLERPWSFSVSRCLFPRRGGCICDAWWAWEAQSQGVFHSGCAWSNSTCVTFSLGAGRSRGPRRRCPSGVRLRRRVHAPAIRHLLQILSPVEQPFHVPRANGHLCCVLRSCHTQYPLSVCQVLASPTPPSPHSCSPKMEKAKADSQASTGFRGTTGQITRKIAQPCLVKSKESLGERMVWKENGKKNVRTLQSLFTFLQQGPFHEPCENMYFSL